MEPHDRRLPWMVIDGNNVKAQRTLFHVAFGKEALRRANHHALLLASHAEFRESGGSSFTVRVRTSTNASVFVSKPIKSNSLLIPRGVSFFATNTYPCRLRYQYASVSPRMPVQFLRLACELPFFAQTPPRRPAHRLKDQSRKDRHSSRAVIFSLPRTIANQNDIPRLLFFGHRGIL